MGADLAVARLRRKESLKTWAQHMGVSVPTLQRLEAGDPGVGIGIVVTALWLIQREGALAQLAAPELDQGAIELDIRQAQARARAQAAALTRSKVRERQTKSTLHQQVEASFASSLEEFDRLYEHLAK